MNRSSGTHSHAGATTGAVSLTVRYPSFRTATSYHPYQVNSRFIGVRPTSWSFRYTSAPGGSLSMVSVRSTHPPRHASIGTTGSATRRTTGRSRRVFMGEQYRDDE